MPVRARGSPSRHGVGAIVAVPAPGEGAPMVLRRLADAGAVHRHPRRTGRRRRGRGWWAVLLALLLLSALRWRTASWAADGRAAPLDAALGRPGRRGLALGAGAACARGCVVGADGLPPPRLRTGAMGPQHAPAPDAACTADPQAPPDHPPVRRRAALRPGAASPGSPTRRSPASAPRPPGRQPTPAPVSATRPHPRAPAAARRSAPSLRAGCRRWPAAGRRGRAGAPTHSRQT